MKAFHTIPRSLLLMAFSASACVSLLTACDAPPDTRGTLYFGAREIGPSISIYRSNIASGNFHAKKVTPEDKWRDLDLDVAKNGDLVFSSNRREKFSINMEKQSEQYNIFIQAAENTAPTQISNSEAHERTPRFSPNDLKIAFIRQSKPEESLMLFDRNSRETRALLSADTLYGHSWSPDGEKLAVAYVKSGQAHLSIYTLSNGEVITPLTFFTAAPEGAEQFSPTDADPFLKSVEAPEWSPDGKYIAFILNPLHQNGVRRLKIYDTRLHSVTSISDAQAQVQSPVQWGKESKILLYSALVDYKFYFNEDTQKKVYEGAMHIFTSDLLKNTRILTSGDHMFRNPVFSPNQKRIAYYYSERLGAREYQLMIMHRSGANTELIYEGVAPNSILHWK